MLGRWQPLSDSEWQQVSHLFADRALRKGRGRPRASDRECLNGVLWLLAGGMWKAMPDGIPSAPTCSRRMRTWRRDGRLAQVVSALGERGLLAS